MQYPFFDFLGASLIPELGANITAGPSGHVHFILISVFAFGTFPDKLFILILHNTDFTVITAHLAEIAFGIQLCIHDMVINVLHHGQNRFNVILHVGNFHVTDGASR